MNAIHKAMKHPLGNPTVILTLGLSLLFGYILYLPMENYFWLKFLMVFGIFFLMFTPIHDSSHTSIAGGNRWLNRLILEWSGFLFLSNGAFFQNVHLNHHAHLGTGPEDPDMITKSRSNFGRIVRSFFLYMHYYRWQFRRFSEGKDREVIPQMILSLLVVAATIFYFYSQGEILKFLLLWALPSFLSVWALGYATTAWPHNVKAPDGTKYQRTRAAESPLLAIILLNQNLHLIHHLWPRYEWWEYPRVYARNKDILTKEKAELLIYPI